MSLCATGVFLWLFAGYLMSPWLWLLVLPALCFVGEFFVKRCWRGAHGVCWLAFISLLGLWGVVTLPLSYIPMLFVACVLESLDSNALKDWSRDNLLYLSLVVHALFWTLVWYVVVGEHLHWLWSQRKRSPQHHEE